MFDYTLLQPAPDLRRVITSYHIINGNRMAAHQKTPSLSKITVLVNYGDAFESYQDGKVVSRYETGAYCSGFFLKPRDFGQRIDRLRVAVIDLAHDVAAAIFRADMQLFTDQAVPLSNTKLHAEFITLPEKLAAAQDDVERITILDDSFRLFFRPRSISSDPFIKRLERASQKSRGAATVQELCEELHLNERTLRRRMAATIGVAPAQYLRTIRAEHVIARLLFEPNANVLDLVHEFAYYDQAHLIRAVKQAISLTPEQIKNMRCGPELASVRALLRGRLA